MSRRKQTIIIRIIFIIGLLLVLYPIVSNIVNEVHNYLEIKEYNALVAQDDIAVESGETTIYEKMFQEARDYNATMTEIPLLYEKDDPMYQKYLETLDVSNGMIGYLNIDKIDVRLGIYHGTQDTTLQKAIGHMESTHLPTGDVGNSTVLTGHTGLSSADLLTDLDQMEIGDTFEVVVLDQIFTYEVFEINVVEPYDFETVAPRLDIDMVTLATCTPYGINSHRLLVQGKQIDTPEETVVQLEKDVDTFGWIYILTIIAIIIVLILCIVFFINDYKWKKKFRKIMENRGKE